MGDVRTLLSLAKTLRETYQGQVSLGDIAVAPVIRAMVDLGELVLAASGADG